VCGFGELSKGRKEMSEDHIGVQIYGVLYVKFEAAIRALKGEGG
jgi:hypothetical protein